VEPLEELVTFRGFVFPRAEAWDSAMKKPKKTFSADKARANGQKPFHLHDRKVLRRERSWKGRLVELVRGKRGRSHGLDTLYEVRYEVVMKGLIEPWMKIIRQVPDRNTAERVFEKCLDDVTTGKA
jgi:hypothetical protein